MSSNSLNFLLNHCYQQYYFVTGQIATSLDKFNQHLRLTALKRGTAVLGETVFDGKSALKLTILNPCLGISDFHTLFEDIDSLAIDLVEKGQ